MNFKTYVENLNKLLTEHPEYGGFNVVTSADDEGNWYSPIYFAPTVGFFADGEFTGEVDFDTLDEINAICVN